MFAQRGFDRGVAAVRLLHARERVERLRSARRAEREQQRLAHSWLGIDRQPLDDRRRRAFAEHREAQSADGARELRRLRLVERHEHRFDEARKASRRAQLEQGQLVVDVLGLG